MPNYTKQQLADTAHAMAVKYGLPRPDMFVRQIIAESRLNPKAVSPVGAAGIAQFMPATGLQYGLRPEDRFDPIKSLDASARYMRDLTKRFNGDQQHATGAYNAGAGGYSRNLEKNRLRTGTPSISIPETRDYMAKIWNSNTDVDKSMRLAGVTMPTIQKPAGTSTLVTPSMYGDSVQSNIYQGQGEFMPTNTSIDAVTMNASDDKYAGLLDKARQQEALDTIDSANYAQGLNEAKARAESLTGQAQGVVDNYKVVNSPTLDSLNTESQNMIDVNNRNDARYNAPYDGTILGALSGFWDRLAGGVKDQADYDRAKLRAMDAAGILNARNSAANVGNASINQAANVNQSAAVIDERGLAYSANPLAAREQLRMQDAQLGLHAQQIRQQGDIANQQLAIQQGQLGVARDTLNNTIGQQALMNPGVIAQSNAQVDSLEAQTANRKAEGKLNSDFAAAASKLGFSTVPHMKEMQAKDPELYNAILNYAQSGSVAPNVVDALKFAGRFSNIIPQETSALFNQLVVKSGASKEEIKRYLAANGVTAASPPAIVASTTEAGVRRIVQNKLMAMRETGTGGGMSNPWRMTAGETAAFIYNPQMDSVMNIGKVRDLFTANPAPSDAAIVKVLSDGLTKDQLVNSVTKFYSMLAQGNESKRQFKTLGLPAQGGYMSGKYDLTNPANAVIVANLANRVIPRGIFQNFMNDFGIGSNPAMLTEDGHPADQTSLLGASK